MPRSKGFALLLLATVLAQNSKGSSTDGTPRNQSESSRLASVKTYAPGDLRQSPKDRLSGGLAQQYPYRMTTDSQGRVLVTDPVLSVVHVFDIRQGKRWQIRGDSHHPLSRPAYIAVDAADNIYVTDLHLSAVLVFEPNGRFKRIIGAGVLTMPTGIWVDRQKRTVYVADWWKGDILSFDLEGNLLRVFGTPGGGPGQLYGPGDVVLQRDTLVVLDAGNSRFELFDLQGNVRATWPFGANRLPLAFAFDGEGNLFYVDLYSGGLVAMDPQGRILGRYGQVRSFGQWTPRPNLSNFMCVATNRMGDILALRPTLNIETVKLTAGVSANAP